ncbi:tRNA 2-thiouridine(34) synthase MnmA [bacterium]|nr:MAG: tRNA 2-thiouridine(34) synthase MnmA [bacterium]
MSGGVDSSVAAALVAETGAEAVGVTLKLLSSAPTGYGCCGSPEDLSDAKRVCETLGISHYVVDMAEVFERDVVDLFVREYAALRTPNPCVECNRSVKFGALLRLAEAWKADAVATGHYAKAERGPGGWVLRRSADEGKDQTYFLHSLTQAELARARFPLGALTKPEVRARARALGLATAEKPESQEICFVPGGDYRALVRERAPEAFAPGPVKTSDGKTVGRHAGLASYTLGQRKGLGVAAGRPLYVTGHDAGGNALLVGDASEAGRASLTLERVSWTNAAPRPGASCLLRARHRGRLVSATLTPLDGGRWLAELSEPVHAPAPGQAAVLYDGDVVLGGGTIS